MGDHQTTSPCKFECILGKYKWVMGFIELLQNPRWPPNHVTYIAPDTLACGWLPDHFTRQVWMHCGQAWVHYGLHWVPAESARWPPNHMTYIVLIALAHWGPPDHHLWIWTCWGNHKHITGFIELLQNPRWPPNRVTYIAPDTLACGWPPDHFTRQVWMHCGQA